MDVAEEAVAAAESASALKPITWSPDARAALLRDASGEIVATTWGGTICWFPRRPSRFAAVAEDGRESVLRCGFCAGCREFDRRRLAARLRAQYADYEGELWLVIVEAPLERQTALAAGLHRSGAIVFEPGFYRLGADAIAFLVKGLKPKISGSRILARIQASSGSPAAPAAPRVRVHRIRRSRGLRAFAIVTAGMLRLRDEYGEQTNRFYHRGLAKRPREIAWGVATRGGISSRHAGAPRNARAWRDGITIQPPSAWSLPRLLHRKGPEKRRTSQLTATGAVLDSLIASFLGRAAEPGSASIAAGAERRLSPMPGIPDAPRARAVVGTPSRSDGSARALGAAPPLDTGRSILERPGYRTSLHSVPAAGRARARAPADLKAHWAATLLRLVKKAEERGED